MRTPQEVHPPSDVIGQIDTVLADLTERDRWSAAAVARMVDDQRAFLSDFATACQEHVRPAMEAVLERLLSGGGGGCIEEDPGGEAPHLTLWMSLQGGIVGAGRPGWHPYLQLDADLVRQEVRVTEGDMWCGTGGGHTDRTGAWQMADVTRDRVTQELVAILRRSLPPPTPHPTPDQRPAPEIRPRSYPSSP